MGGVGGNEVKMYLYFYLKKLLIKNKSKIGSLAIQ